MVRQLSPEFINQFGGAYNRRSVMITGHTGFKGSWLSFWLSKLGASVVGFSKDHPSKPNHFEVMSSPPNMTTCMEDVRDRDKLLQVLQIHQPQIVFHLAAQSLVRHSYEFPLETFSSNIMGTVNVLDCCRFVKSVRAVIIITSDKCYYNDESGKALIESDPKGGADPYSCSKGCAELLVDCFRSSYYQSNGKLLASGRAGNVIGGGDWAKDRLVPDMVRAASVGVSARIRNPNATRPWQHVLEPLSGYLLLGQELLAGNERFAQGWNFGPIDFQSLSVGRVLKLFNDHWSDASFVIDQNSSDPPESQKLHLDSSLAAQALDWLPVWTSEEAIEHTVNWYRRFYESNYVSTFDDLSTYSMEAAKSGRRWAI